MTEKQALELLKPLLEKYTEEGIGKTILPKRWIFDYLTTFKKLYKEHILEHHINGEIETTANWLAIEFFTNYIEPQLIENKITLFKENPNLWTDVIYDTTMFRSTIYQEDEIFMETTCYAAKIHKIWLMYKHNSDNYLEAQKKELEKISTTTK